MVVQEARPAIGALISLQTNDGNTMLKDMSVMHPAAKMLVDLSAAQDVEAGDGTTSVVVIAGSLLGAADRLLAKGNMSRFLFPGA